MKEAAKMFGVTIEDNARLLPCSQENTVLRLLAPPSKAQRYVMACVRPMEPLTLLRLPNRV